mmetsp:Transcript_11816/g.32543  ORF Transcript_11816/g.32543 Transcript_11816/m.32543 type:complete len:329 (-) Transcript_11816:275-1261(-)
MKRRQQPLAFLGLIATLASFDGVIPGVRCFQFHPHSRQQPTCRSRALQHHESPSLTLLTSLGLSSQPLDGIRRSGDSTEDQRRENAFTDGRKSDAQSRSKSGVSDTADEHHLRASVHMPSQSSSQPRQQQTALESSSPNHDLNNDGNPGDESSAESKDSWTKTILDGIPFVHLIKGDFKKLPPLNVQDFDVLFYDIFLLVNLTTSISFWVTHRMSISYLGSAFSEGCLLSIFWIVAGLYHGSFLYTAVDGHYTSDDDRAGPKAAAVLAMNTFVNAINLRLIFALITAVVQHRAVGSAPAEELFPLEITMGLILMCCWRALHSFYTPRL